MIYLCNLKPKGIKKRYKIIVLILAIILLLLVSPIILLNIGKVQRFVVDKVTEALETKMNTKVEIGGVKLRLFNKLDLSDIYIADQQGDTLLFAEDLRVNIAIIPLFKREVELREGILEDVSVHIVTFEDGKSNLQFIFDAFKSPKKGNPFDFNLERIELINSRVSYIDLRGDTTLQKNLFNSKHIELSDLGVVLRFEKFGIDMSGSIEQLHFKEVSGFTLKELNSSFTLTDTLFHIPSFNIHTPKSYFEIDNIKIGYDSLKQLAKQLPDLDINVDWKPSYVYLPDFKYFVPALEHFQQQALLEVKVEGKLKDLKMTNIKASLGNGLLFDGDLDINGLPNLKDAFIYGSINSIVFDKHAIQDVVANFSNKPFVLPDELNRLGECKYQGKITGFINNMVLYGKLNTGIGTIVTDVSFDLFNNLQDIAVKGKIDSKSLRLGSLFPKLGLGDVTFKLNTEIKTGKNVPFAVVANLNIPAITFRKYTYNDIDINGQYSNNKFEGHILLDDDNGRFEFDGEVFLSKYDREFNFVATLKEFNLHQLNLIDKYPNMLFSADITSNLQGNEIENMMGDVNIFNFIFDNGDHYFKMDTFQLRANDINGYHLDIHSDLLNGRLAGSYALSHIGLSARKLLSDYLPVLGGSDIVIPEDKNSTLEFSFQIEPLENLCRTLEIDWFTTQKTMIYGMYDDVKELFNFELSIPVLRNEKRSINDIYLQCYNSDELMLMLRANTPMKKDILYVELNIDAANDTITTHLNWDNKNDLSVLSGEFLANSFLYEVNDTLNIATTIEHTEFMFQNKLWQIQNSKILTNFKTFEIDDLHIFNSDQEILINGIASKNEEDCINVTLKDINLDIISELIPNKEALSFGGYVTGDAKVCRVLASPIIDADVYATSFSFNEGYLGNAHVTSDFDIANNNLSFLGTVTNDDSDTTAIIDGKYFFKKDSLDILGDARALDLSFIKYYLGGIFDEIEGYGTGNVHIYGITKAKTVAVEADAFIRDAKLKIGFLQTTYSFSDSIRMTKDGIFFKNIAITDSEGNKGELNGQIDYSYFKDMVFGIDINLKNMLVLNTTRADFSNFYGKAYASGLVQLTGTDKAMRISCRASTDPGTKIFIPIDSYYASDNSFITFVSDTTITKEKVSDDDFKPASNTDLFIDLMLDVNTNADIQLIIDQKAGDMIKGTGNGALKITFDMRTSALKMYGNYEIYQGEYLFTFQSVLRKYFHVKEGSTITWSGDPIEPIININAYYQLSASLVDILDNATLSNAARSSVPVQCILNLSGNLMQPTIKFDINLPNSDEDLNRALKNAISSEEQMNRQIIGLLLLGKFINPESYQSTNSFISGNELFSVVSSTLSSQLNNWASQLFNNWNFGINFRTSGEGDTRSNEYELNFLYTPNSRIVINGNVGYRDDNLSSSKFIGDFDLEYKLNRSGKLRAKAYTHTNDYKEFKKGLTTQGIGIVYRESFNSVRQLLQSWRDEMRVDKEERAIKREKRQKRKEEKKEKKQAEKRAKIEAKAAKNVSEE